MQKCLIVKEDGLIYVNEVPEEPEYNGEIGHSINVQKQYYEQLEVAKKNAVLVSDQEKATKLLIEADVLFSANTDKPKPKPGIYPIPDLDWKKEERPCEDSGTDDQGRKVDFEWVAILKESTPSTESQEELWRRVEAYINWPYQEFDIDELMKQFTITRRKP